MVEEYLLQCTYYIGIGPPYSYVELRDGPYCTGLLYLNPKTKRFPTLVWYFFLSVKGILGVVLGLDIGPLFVFLPFPSGWVLFLY
jgi:hypothetical protein